MTFPSSNQVLDGDDSKGEKKPPRRECAPAADGLLDACSRAVSRVVGKLGPAVAAVRVQKISCDPLGREGTGSGGRLSVTARPPRQNYSLERELTNTV